MAQKTVAILGTFDTKGEEFAFVKRLFEQRGIGTLTIHCGVYDPTFEPDVSNAQVADAAGADIDEIVSRGDRALGTSTMAHGVKRLVPQLYADGRFDGIFSMGGSGGTSIATAAMQELPVGVPKVMVSTMASGDTTPYVGAADIDMFPSIVDVSGVNSISMTIFGNAVNAMVGMLSNEVPAESDVRPLVALTMFGVTTPCVTKAQELLEERGYETLVFHATGTGGKCMEALVRGGFVRGVLDITTTEWCDELFGGVLAAGPHRNEAAALCGVPAVVSVGAMDMVNFGPWDTVPERNRDRNLYRHNPTVTLMRTTADENRQLGSKLAEKVNMSTGPCAVMLPLRGVSMIDAPGQPFYGPEEDAALFDAVREGVDRSRAELVEVDAHVNDDAFAQAAVDKLCELMALDRSRDGGARG
ncbi:MAG: Tm-1-like ATP-binding domain-containing protein [Coriobacteriales bacterium]|jgi:uncharacterized protein (UPF0261 family)